VLPLLTLGYYILIIDNYATHFGFVQTYCDLASVQLEYLPLYLLDLNLIELTFNVLKAWIQRN